MWWGMWSGLHHLLKFLPVAWVDEQPVAYMSFESIQSYLIFSQSICTFKIWNSNFLISTFTAWRTFRRPTIASWKGTHFQSIALESKTLGHWHAFNRWRLNSLPDGQSMAAISADVRRTPETTKITEIAVKADQTFGITSANPLQREWKAALL